MRQIPEWEAPAPEEFRTAIIPRGRPAVLRGLAAAWPFVAIAKRDPVKLMNILANSASPQPVEILRADPAEEGRFHYRPGGNSANPVMVEVGDARRAPLHDWRQCAKGKAVADPRLLATYEAAGNNWHIKAGTYRLMLGDASDGAMTVADVTLPDGRWSASTNPEP